MYSLNNLKKNYIKIFIISMVILGTLIPLYSYFVYYQTITLANQNMDVLSREITMSIESDLNFLLMIDSSYNLKNSTEIFQKFKNIVFTNDEGKIIYSAKNNYINGLSISNEDTFKKAKFYRKPLVRYVVQSILTSSPAIIIIVPKLKGYTVGIVTNILTKKYDIKYALVDEYNNIRVSNFNQFDLTGNVKKYFSDRSKGIAYISADFYYFKKSKIIDGLYLYIIQEISRSLILLSTLLLIGAIFAIIFLYRFLIKNIKVLTDSFNFVDIFSGIFSKSIDSVKDNITGSTDKLFIYEEKMLKLKTNIVELVTLKNSFNKFFKIIMEDIEEISSRDEEITAMNQDLELMYKEIENYSNQISLIIDSIFKIDTNLSIEEFLANIHKGFEDTFDVESLIIFKINNKIYKVGSIVNLSNNILKIPLIIKYSKSEEIIGNLFISSKDKFSDAESKNYSMFAKILSIFITHKTKENEVEMLYLNLMKALASAVEIKDAYTRGHSERVAKVSVRFAKYLNLKEGTIKLLYRSAILHDIGKIGIPDSILNKEGKLTNEEYNVIKEHPTLGYRIITEIKGMEKEANIIKYHHERWDGKGYPDGLKKDEIPYLSRVISIADSYDAMSSDRSYRKALELNVIKDIFENEKGKQWDPDLVNRFLEIIDEINADNLNG